MIGRLSKPGSVIIRGRRKEPKKYLTISLSVFSVLLILVNLLILYQLKRQNYQNEKMRETIGAIGTTINKIDEALRHSDHQRVFRHVTEAKKQLAALSPPPVPRTETSPLLPSARPVEMTKPTVAEPPPPTATAASYTAAVTTAPLDGPPKAFLLADQGEFLILCEKETGTLSLYRYTGANFSLVKRYPCVLGANNHEKRRPGDFATPVGIYFTTRFVSGRSLPENYGDGAFVLNYPNFLDRREGKKGGGIWIHGHSQGKTLGKDIPDTKGCIVVANEALKELAAMIKAEGTPVVIVDRALAANKHEQTETAKEITLFMDSWRRAWESMNVEKFMNHYAPDFVNSEGMGYKAFKKQKEKVNRGKKFIRIKTEHMAVLLPQGNHSKTAVVRFVQRYQSSNFKSDSRKIFYLSKGQKGWQIIGESTF